MADSRPDWSLGIPNSIKAHPQTARSTSSLIARARYNVNYIDMNFATVTEKEVKYIIK